MNGSDVGALARLALFADLERPELERIAHTYDEEIFPAGQRVLRKGFSGSGLYVVLDGEAVVSLDGNELARLGRGEFFGEVSTLLGGEPTADVAAATPLRCLVVPGPQVERFLLAHPPVALAMLKAEALRLSNVLEWKG